MKKKKDRNYNRERERDKKSEKYRKEWMKGRKILR